MTFKDHALRYVRLGWKVLPLLPRSKVPFPKSNGVKDATNDPSRIAAWSKRNAASNIAIAAGYPSGGLIVLDLDIKNAATNGMTTLQRLIDTHGPLPHAPISKTRSGGCHLWYSDAGRPRHFKKRLPGIDILWTGMFVVAPPSIVNSALTTGAYSWIEPPDGPLQPLPSWFWRLVAIGNPTLTVGLPSGPRPRRLDALVSRVVAAPVGQRDHTLFWAANRALEAAADGHLSVADAAAALFQAGLAIGQTPQEINRALRVLKPT
jgi:Bifunctional DNA primase/polymerase, N-terminal